MPIQQVTPDFGPSIISPKTGVVVIGAGPWVTNYNAPLRTTDMAVARRLAREISERGGGMQAVQTMALPHTDGDAQHCQLSSFHSLVAGTLTSRKV